MTDKIEGIIPTKNSKISGAIIVLALLMMLTSIISVLISATIYSISSEDITYSREERLGTNYIKTKLRCNDHIDGIAVKDFNNQSALYLYQDIDGASYTTILYVYDGYLRELFCDTGAEQDFELDAGNEVTEAVGLELKQSDNSINVKFISKSGNEQSFSYLIKSGSYTLK